MLGPITQFVKRSNEYLLALCVFLCPLINNVLLCHVGYEILKRQSKIIEADDPFMSASMDRLR